MGLCLSHISLNGMGGNSTDYIGGLWKSTWGGNSRLKSLFTTKTETSTITELEIWRLLLVQTTRDYMMKLVERLGLSKSILLMRNYLGNCISRNCYQLERSERGMVFPKFLLGEYK